MTISRVVTTLGPGRDADGSLDEAVIEKINPVARSLQWKKDRPLASTGGGEATKAASSKSVVKVTSAKASGSSAGSSAVAENKKGGSGAVKPSREEAPPVGSVPAYPEDIMRLSGSGEVDPADYPPASSSPSSSPSSTSSPLPGSSSASSASSAPSGPSSEVGGLLGAVPGGGTEAFPRPPSIAAGLSVPREDKTGGVPAGQAANQITVINSHAPKRGLNINSEHPSVRHVKMAPASKRWGGDETEIVISPIYDVLIQMPEAIEFFKSSSTLLTVATVPSNPNLVTLKLGPVQNAAPISLHLVDTSQNIYTFSVVGTPADLAWEYPKTIVVSRRVENKVKIGAANPRSIIDAMDVDDAIQIVVGDVPNSSEYAVEFVSGHYMDYEGYAQYGFRVSRKDKGDFSRLSDGRPDLKFTIWANGHRLDAGNSYAASREIEWTVEPILSRRETRRRGYEVMRVFVQIRAGLLDLEEWSSAFITASNEQGYTRFDFPPLIREFRAPARGDREDE